MTETTTLTRPKPRIDHPAELEWIVQRIVERVDPVAIYLFGSRARGEGVEDSDYDTSAKDSPVHGRSTVTCKGQR